MKVLVPLDGSPEAEAILPYVEKIKSKVNEPVVATLLVVVRQHEGEGGRSFGEPEEGEAARYLGRVADELESKGLNVATAIKQGQPAEVIAEYATKGGFDLIAMGSHGRSGVSRWMMGSVTDKVFHLATVPLLVVRNQAAVDIIDAIMNKPRAG